VCPGPWLVGGGGVALVGVVGSRSVVPPGVASCVRSLVAAGHQVVTGCAPAGIDAAVRAAAPGCLVVRAAGRQPWQLAARTRALVAQLAASPGSRLVAWPSAPCPPVCSPGSSSAGGVGTWLAVALAVSAGVPVLLMLPAGVAAPAWPGGVWAPVAACGPWAAAVTWQPGAVQASLL
jgi:hypothetical protein